jgi:hypothetical protein
MPNIGSTTLDAGLHHPWRKEPRQSQRLARPRPIPKATTADPYHLGQPPLRPEATAIRQPQRCRELRWGLNPLKFGILNKKIEC